MYFYYLQSSLRHIEFLPFFALELYIFANPFSLSTELLVPMAIPHFRSLQDHPTTTSPSLQKDAKLALSDPQVTGANMPAADLQLKWCHKGSGTIDLHNATLFGTYPSSSVFSVASLTLFQPDTGPSTSRALNTCCRV